MLPHCVFSEIRSIRFLSRWNHSSDMKFKARRCSENSIIIIIFVMSITSTKPQAEILELNNVNGCNDISFGDHSILEGDRIAPLKSHGQALEEELCFPGVLSDNRDAPANLLRHFYGCLMPCTCCLDLNVMTTL